MPVVSCESTVRETPNRLARLGFFANSYLQRSVAESRTKLLLAVVYLEPGVVECIQE
jgi:hypothetical protein